MKAILNRALLEQVDLDSGSISVLTAVIHRFAEPGTYPGIVMRGDRKVGNFTVVVEDQPKSTQPREIPEPIITAAELVEPKQQVNLNLRELEISALKAAPTERRLGQVMKTGGYVVFHVPSGPGGYSVKLCKKDKEAAIEIFDSTELGSDDLFSAMVLRPGTYSITKAHTPLPIQSRRQKPSWSSLTQRWERYHEDLLPSRSNAPRRR